MTAPYKYLIWDWQDKQPDLREALRSWGEPPDLLYSVVRVSPYDHWGFATEVHDWFVSQDIPYRLQAVYETGSLAIQGIELVVPDDQTFLLFKLAWGGK